MSITHKAAHLRNRQDNIFNPFIGRKVPENLFCHCCINELALIFIIRPILLHIANSFLEYNAELICYLSMSLLCIEMKFYIFSLSSQFHIHSCFNSVRFTVYMQQDCQMKGSDKCIWLQKDCHFFNTIIVAEELWACVIFSSYATLNKAYLYLLSF